MESADRQAVFASETPECDAVCVIGRRGGGVRILDLSPIFHALATHANALSLSADQKTLLKDLEDVTREGYVWIGRRNLEGSSGPEDAGNNRADQIPKVRSEFLKHAKQAGPARHSHAATGQRVSGRDEEVSR